MASDTFIIKNGRIINNTSDLDIIGDIFVKNNKIISVGAGKNAGHHVDGNIAEFDASECLILPGLIDIHVHAYEHATPLGINIDKYCLARGVTTVVDAGSSGACTFPGLKKFIIENSSTRLLCFLHIATHGLAAAKCAGPGGGECDHLNQVIESACSSTINDNRNLIVGVKVRITSFVTDNGRLEQEVFRRAIAVARKCQVPLMVHHIVSTIPVEPEKHYTGLTCPGDLTAGDIYTHCFHGHETSLVDDHTNTVFPAATDAKQRGVVFDVGHGQGSFSWKRARTALEDGFFPDTISTDQHSGNIKGPVYDLLLVMSRFLHLGMPLRDIAASVTSRAAQAVGRAETLGSLEAGREADITILKIVPCDMWLEDCMGKLENLKSIFVPVAVWKDGKQFQIEQLPNYPFTG